MENRTRTFAFILTFLLVGWASAATLYSGEETNIAPDCLACDGLFSVPETTCDGTSLSLSFTTNGTAGTPFSVFFDGITYDLVHGEPIYVLTTASEFDFLELVFEDAAQNCFEVASFDNPCFESPCVLNTFQVTTTCQPNGLYTVDINFDPGSLTTGVYNLTIAGNSYGEQSYQDLPFTATDVSISGMFGYNIIICQTNAPECCYTYSASLPPCEADCATIFQTPEIVCDGNETFISFTTGGQAGTEFVVTAAGQSHFLLHGQAEYIIPVVLEDVYFEVVFDDGITGCVLVEGFDSPCFEFPCSIYELSAVASCQPNGLYLLTVDFAPFNPTHNSFDLFINGQQYGFYPYSALPLVLEDVAFNTLGTFTLSVCENDNPNCCASITQALPPCAPDCSTIFQTPQVSCDGTTTILNFTTGGAPGTEFVMTAAGQSFFLEHGQSSYSIPIELDDVYFEVIFDDGITGCVLVEEYDSPCFEFSCSINELSAVASCQPNGFHLLTVDFAPFNPTHNSFDLFINGQQYGFYPYSALPLVLEDVAFNTLGTFTLSVCENDNPNCCAEQTFNLPPCALPTDCLAFNAPAVGTVYSENTGVSPGDLVYQYDNGVNLYMNTFTDTQGETWFDQISASDWTDTPNGAPFLFINYSVATFTFPHPVQNLCFTGFISGHEINLGINDQMLTFSSLLDPALLTAFPGVTIDVESIPGTTSGNFVTVCMSGNIAVFSLGGIEMILDDLCTGAYTCAISNLNVGQIACENNTDAPRFFLDFDHNTAVADSFRLRVNNELYGIFAYADLPLSPITVNVTPGTPVHFLVRDMASEQCVEDMTIISQPCDHACDFFMANVTEVSCVDDPLVLEVQFTLNSPADSQAVYLAGVSGIGFYQEVFEDEAGVWFTITGGIDPFGYVLEDSYTGCFDTISPMELNLEGCFSCEIELGSATPTPCGIDGTYGVEFELAYATPWYTYMISLYGEEYGPFSLEDFPVTVGSIPANAPLPITAFIWAEGTNCSLPVFIEQGGCEPDGCQNFDVSLAGLDCAGDEIFVVLDVEGVQTGHPLRIVSQATGVVSEPIFTTNPLVIMLPLSLDGDTLAIQYPALGCEDIVAFSLPPDCLPSCNTIFSAPEIACDGTTYVHFTTGGLPGTEFVVTAAGQSFVFQHGQISYTITVAVNTPTFTVVFDDALTGCVWDGQFDAPCENNNCLLEDVTIEPTACNPNSVYGVTVNFTTTRPDLMYRVRVGTQTYGPFAYSAFPVTVGSIVGVTPLTTPIRIWTEGEICDYNTTITHACPQPCEIYQFHAYQTCEGGMRSVRVNVGSNLPELSQVQVLMNDVSIGTFAAGSFPRWFNLPFDIGQHVVFNLIALNADCQAETDLTVVSCDDLCDNFAVNIAYAEPDPTFPGFLNVQFTVSGAGGGIPIVVTNIEFPNDASAGTWWNNPETTTLPVAVVPGASTTTLQFSTPFNNCSTTITVEHDPVTCGGIETVIYDGTCTTTFEYMVVIDIPNAQPEVLYAVMQNGMILEEFLGSAFPVTLSVTPNTTNAWELIVGVLGTQCFQNMVFEPANCNPDCPENAITDVNIYSEGCNNIGTYAISVNFNSDTHDVFDIWNQTTGQRDTVLITELPSTFPPVPAGVNTSAIRIAPLGVSGECVVEQTFSYFCPPPTCDITDLMVTGTDCDPNGLYYLQIDFNSNADGPFFITNEATGQTATVLLSQLPYTMGPINWEQVQTSVIYVASANVACEAETVHIQECNSTEPCGFSNLIVEPYACDGGQFMVDVAFDNPNGGAAGFYIFGDGMIFGPFPYGQNFYTFGPLNGNTPNHTVLILDIANPACFANYNLNYTCSDDCQITNATVSVLPCQEDLFSILIDVEGQFLGEQFTLVGNGVNYGTFSYDALPITIDGFLGDGQSVYELGIIDLQNPNCTYWTSFAAPNCLPCDIRDLTYEIECTEDFYTLTLDFIVENPQSDGFRLFIGDVDLGPIGYHELPLHLEELNFGFSDPILHVEDLNDPNCGATVPFDLPCCNLGTALNAIQVGTCEDNGSFYLTIGNFNSFNTSDTLLIDYAPAGSNIIQTVAVAYADLPTTIEAFRRQRHHQLHCCDARRGERMCGANPH
ncbi:MAG: hypothetical protein R2795_07810 [Saprospiraceae bacterium]